jgi:hypothetical protein
MGEGLHGRHVDRRKREDEQNHADGKAIHGCNLPIPTQRICRCQL